MIHDREVDRLSYVPTRRRWRERRVDLWRKRSGRTDDVMGGGGRGGGVRGRMRLGRRFVGSWDVCCAMRDDTDECLIRMRAHQFEKREAELAAIVMTPPRAVLYRSENLGSDSDLITRGLWVWSEDLALADLMS